MMQIRTFLLISMALRAGLIAYGEVQDRFFAVKYTDIDYNVFTDAARFVVQGESPFLRSTYRYSPLLAYLLLPNILLTRIWGKVVFAAADIGAAWQIWRIGQLQHASAQRCFWSVALWLYNPFTITISTRGSCDSIVTVMLLAVLLLMMRGRCLLATALYGLAVHFRIYPIIYAPAIVLHLAHKRLAAQQPQRAGSSSSKCTGIVKWMAAVLQQGLLFGCVSGGTFLLLGWLFYQLYGQLFLHEAFLYHLGRKDPRHSFSAYYYPVYLDFMDWPAQPAAGGLAGAAATAAGTPSLGSSHIVQPGLQVLLQLPAVDAGKFAVVPQMLLVLVFAAAMHRNLSLCWLLQTIAFVAFNKVSTAQYFLWYYSLLPVGLLSMPWPLPRWLRFSGTAWVVTQVHWLLWAYMLEFQGQGVHLMLWAAGVLFLLSNAACMASLLDCCIN